MRGAHSSGVAGTPRSRSAATSIHTRLSESLGVEFGVSQHYHGDAHTFRSPENSGLIKIRETAGYVVLDEVIIDEKSTGFGTKLVENLKAYCDEKGSVLRIPEVENESFFDRFEWLEWHAPGEEEIFYSATYRPE